MRRLFALLLGAASFMACAQSPETDFADCVQRNFPQHSAQQKIRLVSTDRTGGTAKITARIFWQPSRTGQNRFHVRVDEPLDLANSAYLLVQEPAQESLFVYVPGLNRVRRMRGEAMSGELWGTSLDYADLQYLHGIALNTGFSPAGQAQLGTRPVQLFKASVPPAAGWGYAGVQVALDIQTCIVLQVEFADEQGEIEKRLSADPASLEQIDGYWIARKAVVEDLRRGTRTQLEVLRAEFDQRLPLGLFDSRGFYLTRLPKD